MPSCGTYFRRTSQAYFTHQTFEYPMVEAVPIHPDLTPLVRNQHSRRQTWTTWQTCRRRWRCCGSWGLCLRGRVFRVLE